MAWRSGTSGSRQEASRCPAPPKPTASNSGQPAGAKRHCLEPWAYVRDVLLRLSAGEMDLETLLPDRWGASHPEHVLQHRLDEVRRKAARQKEARATRRAAGGPRL